MGAWKSGAGAVAAAHGWPLCLPQVEKSEGTIISLTLAHFFSIWGNIIQTSLDAELWACLGPSSATMRAITPSEFIVTLTFLILWNLSFARILNSPILNVSSGLKPWSQESSCGQVQHASNEFDLRPKRDLQIHRLRFIFDPKGIERIHQIRSLFNLSGSELSLVIWQSCLVGGWLRSSGDGLLSKESCRGDRYSPLQVKIQWHSEFEDKWKTCMLQNCGSEEISPELATHNSTRSVPTS